MLLLLSCIPEKSALLRGPGRLRRTKKRPAGRFPIDDATAAGQLM
jgi:hypothetical protein